MNMTKYLYTSQFTPGAKVIATYVDGHLSALEGLQNIGLLWESIPINSPIPFQESEIKMMADLYDYAVEVCLIEVRYDTTIRKRQTLYRV